MVSKVSLTLNNGEELRVGPWLDTRPATVADLVEILPTIGAESIELVDGYEFEDATGLVVGLEPGTYLVLKVDE